MIQDEPVLRDAIEPTELIVSVFQRPLAPGTGPRYSVEDVLNGIRVSRMDSVLETWAHTLAVLHRSAPAHPAPGDDPGVGARIVSQVPEHHGSWVPDALAARARAAAAELITAAGAGDLDALEPAFAEIRRGSENFQTIVLSTMATALAAAVNDGGPHGTALAAAAARRDTDAFHHQIATYPGGDDGIAGLIIAWAPIIAATIATAADTVPGNSTVSMLLTRVLTANVIDQRAAETVLHVTGFAPQERDATLGGLYALAQTMHATVAAAGGAERLRFALQLHALAFTSSEALLCRRGAAITAAAAAGQHSHVEQYLRAARIVHGDAGVHRLADTWLRILGQHLIELAPAALGDPEKTLAALFRGPLAGFGPREWADITTIFAAIEHLLTGDPDPADTLASAATESGTTVLEQLIRLTALLLTTIDPDPDPAP